MGTPILVYHRITDSPLPALRRYAVRPAAFRRQMRALRHAGWRAVGLDQVLSARAAGKPLPRRTVVISFDDAYAEVETEALPALAANGHTATVFACSALLGARSDRLRDRDPGEEAVLMDAEALRRARGKGFAIGSHTRTHRRLTGLADGELADELAGSRSELSTVLGEEVRHLAYPFGDYDERVSAAAAAAGYASAVSTDPGFATNGDSPFALPRAYVSWGDGALRLLARLLRGDRTPDGAG